MDSILSVRINEEVKEKFVKLAEEQGVNNKEFLDLIIKNYEINKVSTEIDFVKNDIEELQSIVKRVLDIYINIIDKNKLRTTELINNFNANLREEKEKTEGFTVEISEVKRQLDELKSENKELKNSNKELQSLLSKEKEALNESREMNIILKDKLKDFNLYKEENESLKKCVETSERSLKEIQGELYDVKQSYENANREREALKIKADQIMNSNEDVIENLKHSYENQLTLRENELSLKMRQELLQKEQSLREELWELKANYDERISKLMKEKEELLFKFTNKIDK